MTVMFMAGSFYVFLLNISRKAPEPLRSIMEIDFHWWLARISGSSRARNRSLALSTPSVDQNRDTI